MPNKRIISAETMQKLENMFQTVKSIASECNPSKMDTEPSFQKQFFENAVTKQKECGFTIDDEIKTPILKTPKTTCISDSNAKFWKADFVIKVDNAIIPIELKLRHKGQEINGYAQDFIDDVDKCRKLIINYDDSPKCYIVMLTDNPELKNQCETKAEEYTLGNNIEDYRKISIKWEKISSTYYIGIVGRVQSEERQNNPKGKLFVFLSKEQKEQFDTDEVDIDSGFDFED